MLKTPPSETALLLYCVILRHFVLVSRSSVKVAAASRQQCKSHGYISLSGSISGYLASSSVTSSDQGYDCPWRIGVMLGQRIQIQQIIFAGLRTNGVQDGKDQIGLSTRDVCYEVGIVTEDSSRSRNTFSVSGVHGSGNTPGSPLKVCASLDRLDGRGTNCSTLIHLSKGSTVTIRFHSIKILQDLSPFLIKYEGFFIDQ